jgi:RNA polymerase sigma-70 factor (ECF subfamily)
MVHDTSHAGAYEMKEHMDFCFTCISKTLLIENQVALILKDIYDFQVREIGLILGKTEGVIKHLLNDARNIMTGYFRGPVRAHQQEWRVPPMQPYK